MNRRLILIPVIIALFSVGIVSYGSINGKAAPAKDVAPPRVLESMGRFAMIVVLHYGEVGDPELNSARFVMNVRALDAIGELFEGAVDGTAAEGAINATSFVKCIVYFNHQAGCAHAAYVHLDGTWTAGGQSRELDVDKWNAMLDLTDDHSGLPLPKFE